VQVSGGFSLKGGFLTFQSAQTAVYKRGSGEILTSVPKGTVEVSSCLIFGEKVVESNTDTAIALFSTANQR